MEVYILKENLTEKELVDMKEIPKVDFTYAHEHWKKRREESVLNSQIQRTKIQMKTHNQNSQPKNNYICPREA